MMLLDRTIQPKVRDIEHLAVQMPRRSVMPNGVLLNVLDSGDNEVVRIDLLMEGGRWFDIKRFDIEITHEAYQTGATDVLARRDLRRAVQIPEEVISYGVVPNPR